MLYNTVFKTTMTHHLLRHLTLKETTYYYYRSGPNKWRDCMKPSAILQELCAKNHIPPPVFVGTGAVMVNGINYTDNGITDK